MEEKIFYETEHNYKLCGILNKVNEEDTIAVICHARTSSKDSRPTTNLANMLTENNINNFRFDFVASGESDGDYNDYTVTNMVKNLNDTLLMLKTKYEYSNFILIGCSMGSRIISLADHKNYNVIKMILWYGALDYGRGILNLPSKKEKIAKKNGYYSGENDWKFTYNYFVDERKYRAYRNLYELDMPKLFIHGTNDPFVNFKSSVKVSKKCKNSKLILIENGDHGFHNEENMREALIETLNFIQDKV